MNNIILIDDIKAYVDSFVAEAKVKHINVSTAKSLEGLKKILPKFAHKFAGVVLDIKCLLTDDQPKEDASFIGDAMQFLDMNVPNFPRFILTGDQTEFDKLKGFYPKEKMYLKTPEDQERLLNDLILCIANSETLKIKRDNIKVFEVFETGKMNNAAELQLLKIIGEGLIEKNFINFKGILADIRALQENIYKSINSRNKAVVPDNMFRPNGMIKFNDLMKHLYGNSIPPIAPTTIVYQNPTIYQLSNSLYWICGEYIHDDPNRTYFISDNTLKSLIYNLMELIIWSKQY